VLSGRGLRDELITHPQESYRLCCVVVCDLETSRIGAPYIYDISNLRVKEHRVAAILLLLFMVLISLVPALTPLYLYVSTFGSRCVVPIIIIIINYFEIFMVMNMYNVMYWVLLREAG
jgi:hypothetical protein